MNRHTQTGLGLTIQHVKRGTVRCLQLRQVHSTVGMEHGVPPNVSFQKQWLYLLLHLFPPLQSGNRGGKMGKGRRGGHQLSTRHYQVDPEGV